MDPFKTRKVPRFLQAQEKLASKLQVHVEHGVFRSLSLERPTSTFAPQHYEANYSYPLIIWMHGDGKDESQLIRVMPMISLRNYMAVSLRGKRIYSRKGIPEKGFFWPHESYDDALAGVLECINITKTRYNISSDRIYLVGSGGGGTMALHLAFKNPQFFAGVASLDGPFPRDTMLLEHIKKLRKVRILLSISRGSEKNPVSAVCENLPLLHAAGLLVTVRNYPTAGTLQADMLRDVDRWIMGGMESAIK
ncbi:MAG: alpha/beta hydrolase-fold protein [Planctomycetia bacterium]|nr:alpha/beta hydrolase-fold protein [Planctomycetia bacterium]